MKRLQSLVSLVFISLLWASSISYADEQQALKFYEKAEDFYKQENYQQAKEWYLKALEHRKADGKIRVVKKDADENTTTKYIRWGRTMKKLKQENYSMATYYPNKRLQEVDLFIEIEN